MRDSLKDRLQSLAESDFYPFHMPGHKRLIFDNGSYWYMRDISEISGFDNLHYPKDILLTAQKKAALAYQAEKTFFLVGGSTAGILSAVSAAMTSPPGRGKKLLISRGSHLSVYHAAYLNRLPLAYIYPRVEERTGLVQGITAASVAEKLKDDPEIGAVLITSPTYEGVLSDIAGIAATVHREGICLLVDQAHGAHFGFHAAFPESAVRQGADIIIHGLHKTLPAFTQTALLHVCGERIDRRILARYLRVFQSSSPSYPLMAGIERCLDLVEKQGAAKFGKLLELRKTLADRISKLKHFSLADSFVDNNAKGPENWNDGAAGFDPCKLVILIRRGSFWGKPGGAGLKALPKNGRLTGKILSEILRDKYHLEMEMAAPDYIVAIITIMDRPEGFARLARALAGIDRQLVFRGEEELKTELEFDPPEMITPLHVAYDSETVNIPPGAAVGYTAAEFVIPYPPGIPLLVPGEKITARIIGLMGNYQENQLSLTGLTEEGNISCMKK